MEGFAGVRTWLVTGAAGFIGSHVVEDLLLTGQSVVGFDNFSTGSRENLEDVARGAGSDFLSNFRLVVGDIRDRNACFEACQGIDAVVHLAAMASVPASLASPETCHAVNVNGFLKILSCARATGVKRVVYASSSAVYGDDEGLPKVEARTGKPLSPYALSKKMDEELADMAWRLYGLPCVGLRFFNVYGTRQDPKGPYAAVIPIWTAALERLERPVIYGDGTTTRDFISVKDVVRAIRLAAGGGKRGLLRRGLQHRRRTLHEPGRAFHPPPGRGRGKKTRGGGPIAALCGFPPRRHPALHRGHLEGPGPARLRTGHFPGRRPRHPALIRDGLIRDRYIFIAFTFT